MAREENFRVTKVFVEQALGRGDYRTVRVYATTTFASLREKMLEKQKSGKAMVPCFEILFK